MPNKTYLLAVGVAVTMLGCGPRQQSGETAESSLPLTQLGVGYYQEISWSPDGSAMTVSILEMSETPEGFQYRVHRLALDPPGIAPLSGGPMDLWTSWAPDGNRIAYSSRSGATSDIYVMKADGSNSTRLTNDPADDIQPDWSTDGTRIAFISNRDNMEQVYVMNVDGSGQTLIGHCEKDAQNPVWSPDGKQIAYYETDADGNDDIYVMNSDGTERHHLAKGVWPSWSRDGNKILCGAPSGLSLINTDGTNESLLVSDVEYGVFSPNGRKIAYINTVNGQVTVNIMNADGSGSVCLVTRPAPEW